MREGRLRLIRGTKRNDDPKRSFERNYQESYSLVYNYVYRRVPNRESAEDVVADAFLRAARFYDRFDEQRAKFSTWVISIARNCISDFYEHNQPSTNLEDVPEGVYAVESGEEERIADDEIIQRLLGCLDDEEREMVFMKYYQGMRNVEIAQELGMNASTVSTKLARTIAKLRAAS